MACRKKFFFKLNSQSIYLVDKFNVLMDKSQMKNKKLLISIFFILIISISFITYSIYDDKRNNIPDSVEKIIPKPIKDFLIKNIFYKKKFETRIKRLEQRIINKDKELKSENKVVDKLLNDLYLMGLDSLKFEKVRNKEKLTSKNGKNFVITTFQTDYLSSNTWPHTRATAYIEKFDNNIILVSKDGVISYFDIKNLDKDNFETKIVKSNIREIINYDEWWSKPGGKGLKDVLVDEDKIYISFMNLVDKDCYNTSILVAEIDFKQLEFQKFFEPPNCLKVRKGHNRWSDNSGGGRIFKYDDQNFLFSHGGFKTRVKSQDDKTVFGKIILINKNSKDWSIISKGHRNVQGLFYNKEKRFVISTEHGPRGGDEININDLKDERIKNFGWPISSYGEHYGPKEKNLANYEEAPLYKSHKDYGFDEPLKFFVPSIGISEIKIVPNKFDNTYLNDYFIGSMGNNIKEGDLSIHHIKLNNTNNKIIYHDIIAIDERVRDLMYLEELNKFLLFIENSASLATLENTIN